MFDRSGIFNFTVLFLHDVKDFNHHFGESWNLVSGVIHFDLPLKVLHEHLRH